MRLASCLFLVKRYQIKARIQTQHWYLPLVTDRKAIDPFDRTKIE